MSSRVSDKEKSTILEREPNLNEFSYDKETDCRFVDFLKNGIDNIPENYMAIIKKIHLILADCSDLSSKQKLEYCNIERYFIKLYLKDSI